MKERYEIIKRIYPDYLILFLQKDKIKLIGIDKEIVEIFGLEHIKEVNKIVLNNLDIEEKKEYKNNQYDLYYIKTKLIKMLKTF